jgi:hypothetical protein
MQVLSCPVEVSLSQQGDSVKNTSSRSGQGADERLWAIF